MRLGDIAKERKETYKGDKGGIRLIGLEHLISGELRFTDYDIDTENTFSKVFHKGDILFGRRRAYLKKAAIAEFDGICSGDITVIQAIPNKVNPELLPFIIQNNALFDFAVSRSAGGLSPRVKWEHLADYEFELPTISQQRVLAEKLWAAYNLKEAYKKMNSAIDEMVKSQFIEMSGDWGRHKLDSFIDIVRGVSYKPTDVVDSNNPCATGILRANNISDGELNTVEMVYVNNERVSEIQKLRPKDIVMCASSGSQYLVGKAAINKHLHSNYAHGAFCLLIRCKELLMPEFLNLYLQTDDYRGQIEEKSCGSNILNIKQSDITSLIIPIPNFAVQQNFVTILKQADKSKFELKQAIDKIEKVMKSLLQ